MAFLISSIVPRTAVQHTENKQIVANDYLRTADIATADISLYDNVAGEYNMLLRLL